MLCGRARDEAFNVQGGHLQQHDTPMQLLGKRGRLQQRQQPIRPPPAALLQSTRLSSAVVCEEWQWQQWEAVCPSWVPLPHTPLGTSAPCHHGHHLISTTNKFIVYSLLILLSPLPPLFPSPCRRCAASGCVGCA
jgi:hypothetical protein